MSRNRDNRWEGRDSGRNQSRDQQGGIRDRGERYQNSDRDYNVDRGREYHWSNEDRGYSDSYNYRDNPEYRSQYFAGREDYPGPGRAQGFGRGRRHDIGQWGNSNYSQNTSNREHQRMSDRSFDQPSRHSQRSSQVSDMREYGYGSGTTDMPARRTWNRREDESYNWGDHSGESQGQFRGKGPKGYRRTDERIREEINEILSDDDQLDASEIVISVSNGEVSLTGTVSDRASKRRAEDLVENVAGVSHVENRIRIGKVTPEEPIRERETANGRTKTLQGV
jgi:osmotically-inducible protein OsmY